VVFDLPHALEALQVAALLEADAAEPTLPRNQVVRRLLRMQPSSSGALPEQFTVTHELMVLGGDAAHGGQDVEAAVSGTRVRAGVQGFRQLAVSFHDHELCVVRHERGGVTVLLKGAPAYVVPRHLYDNVATEAYRAGVSAALLARSVASPQAR
jgi:hypothetical protein